MKRNNFLIGKSLFFLAIIPFFVCSTAMAGPTIQEIQEEINETLKDKLNLSEDQLSQIKIEQAKQVSERKKLAAQEEAKRVALKAELEKINSNQKTVDTLVSELNTVRAEVIDLRVNSVENLKKILDADQYQKVVELQQEEKEEKVEKKKKVDEKWDAWKKKNNFKKREKKKWYYYYWQLMLEKLNKKR